MSIAAIRDAVRRVAPLYPILSVDLFGSYADGKATSRSDVDLLVCFDLKQASLFDLSGLRLDIEDLLHKNVDIVAGPVEHAGMLDNLHTVRLYEA